MENAVVPKEIVQVLNMEFMGVKLWHVLLISLILPSPMYLFIVLLFFPGFKEKVLELIKNGFSRVSAVSASSTGEGYQVNPEGNPPNPSAS